MRYWENAESKLPTFRNQRQRRNFIIKLRSLAFVILGMALGSTLRVFIIFSYLINFDLISVEHMLSVAAILHFSIVCRKNNDPLNDLLETQSPYLFSSGSQIFDLICGQFINLTATFVWNFLDVFVIIISNGLSTMFELFNEDLKRANGKV